MLNFSHANGFCGWKSQVLENQQILRPTTKFLETKSLVFSTLALRQPQNPVASGFLKGKSAIAIARQFGLNTNKGTQTLIGFTHLIVLKGVLSFLELTKLIYGWLRHLPEAIYR